MGRKYTNKLIDWANDGVIDWESLSRDLLSWLSENEVEQFAFAFKYVEEEYEDEE
jgi:hypothetical protein